MLGEELALSEKQFKNWYHGRVKSRPYPKAGKVLEAMFPPWTVQELLARPDSSSAEPVPQASDSRRTDPEGAPSAPESLLATDARQSARFALAMAATNVSDVALEQLDADVDRLARTYVSQPVTTLFEEIRSLRADVFRLLEGRQRPGQTSHLFLAAARLCGLSAHVCLDLGDYSSATTQARTARQCAELAGSKELVGWIRSVESLIAYWDGRPTEAVSLARAGRANAGSPSATTRLASLEARACARVGDAEGALAALRVSQEARHLLGGGEQSGGGVFEFPEAKQWAYAGTTLLTIGGAHLGAAIDASTRAVELYRTAPDADRSSGDLLAAHVDLAGAHLAVGDLDATRVMAEVVLGAPVERRTASILRRMHGLAESLSPPARSGSPVARTVRSEILDFCRSRPALPQPSAHAELTS
ncbi:XRE family transcriptional regulator [Allostreptomyces psammosilenae]|uniref:XRE family transcriptional regulator n=1 Tax=Allostreptomyces psammosilenae TaxID=1892865 RepID=A0A853A4C1_9ACTN|nr:XRE family transcriptional regulator [Allostreptomyces psammosilenae]NYI05551.1 hypothetical protein [Allostreptomyces psammosilenae]